MAESEIADWAANVSSQPYSKRVYNISSALAQQTLFRWIDIRSEGVEHLQTTPPVIIAPVHRSNLDALIVGVLKGSQLPTMSKESLFKIKPVAWWISCLGAIPLDRDAADREATHAARRALDAGKPLMIFPEGGRRFGSTVAELFDGTAWIASKTGASIVPVGIAGTEELLPQGGRVPKRGKVGVVAGEPLELPEGRIPRSKLSQITVELRERLQGVNDRAHQLIGNELAPD